MPISSIFIKRTIKDIIANEKEETLEEYYLAMEGDEFYD